MAIRWTQAVDGGPRRVNHAAVSVRNRFIFSFGGYCTGEEYNQIIKIDVHVFDTGKPVEVIVPVFKQGLIILREYARDVSPLETIFANVLVRTSERRVEILPEMHCFWTAV